MPVGYEPRHFFNVAFACAGSTAWHLALPRAIGVLPVSITFCCLVKFDVLALPDDYNLASLALPFTLLLGLVTSFRLNDSFKKWDRATQLSLMMHRETRIILSRLCTMLPDDDPAVTAKIIEIRRLVLLGCVLLKQHVRDEKSLDMAEQVGLLTASEKRRLTETVTMSDGPTGDGKKDKYPTRSRPTFAFQEASLLAHQLMKGKYFSCPHTYWGIETAITTMSNILEDSEHLATSLLPLPYAQLTRLLSLGFLMVIPLAYTSSLGWTIIPLSFVANTVYFLIDECSGQMETPFGEKPNDVALEKTLRRIDKLTAAQLCQFLGRPVSNYNLYAEKRSTDGEHHATNTIKAMGHSEVVAEPVHTTVASRLTASIHHSTSGRSSSPTRPITVDPTNVTIQSAVP